jgi:L-2-hydroxyglutarate oxidase LhgO
MIYDVIIIGGGISGLYSFYKIKQLYKNKNKNKNKYKCLLLEKDSRLGGRAGNINFHGSQIAIGAGILRKNKDKLLINLCKKLKVPLNEFTANTNYDKIKNQIPIINIIKTLRKLKSSMKTLSEKKKRVYTFKQYFISIFGKKYYDNFKKTLGYTDYENEDMEEVINHYGMDDNLSGWKGYGLSWNTLIEKLVQNIGKKNIKMNTSVEKIKLENNDIYKITTNNKTYYTKKVIIGSTIDTIKKLIKNNIYNNIGGQPFLRIYGLFEKKCIPILKNAVISTTIVNSPLYKIIPINPDKGIYMIVYNDNKGAKTLKKYAKNTPANRQYLSKMVSKSLGIIQECKLKDIKSFYWNIGTHYYKPLKNLKFKDRNEYIKKAQNPQKNMYVVGEMISHKQGWTEGAIESVEKIVYKL